MIPSSLKFIKKLNLPRQYLLEGIEPKEIRTAGSNLEKLEIEYYDKLKNKIESNLLNETNKSEFVKIIENYQNSYNFSRAIWK